MKRFRGPALFIVLLLLGVGCQPALAVPPVSKSSRLANGIRIVSVYFQHSTNVTIFTFLPMGLAADGAGQTQWAHLVEHLVIRSTVASDLSIANAETLPDHMRLDFYAGTNNWKEGVSHVQRWLRGAPFTTQSLTAEKPKVNQEVDYTVKNCATHKFALAAWAQAVRHGERYAAVRGDIDRAVLSEIQAYRDSRLALLSNIVVCVVGGIGPDQIFPEAAEQLGHLASAATRAPAVKLHPGKHEVSWDLNAHHLVLSWPIPTDPASSAALLTAANWLNMQFVSDTQLQKIAGMTLAGADLTIPEGEFFYISSCLRPGHSFQEAQEQLRKYVSKLSAADADLSWASSFGQQQAQAFVALPDTEALRGQLPQNVTMAMLEGNLGLQWGMNEFRYGSRKPDLVTRLSELKPEEVRQCAREFLSDSTCSVVTLQPGLR